jgi:uncharacterized protein with beta-barrel porin domain
MSKARRLDILARRACAAALVVGTGLSAGTARGQNATWVGGNGGDPNEWVENNNWAPAAVPSGTATFTGIANTTSVANDAGTVIIGGIKFTTGALAYTFSVNNAFIINGAGVANNSTNTQTFNISLDNLVFQNGSSANSGTGNVTYNNNGNFIFFQNTSNAGNANTTFVSNGIIQFSNTSSAGSANFTNNVQMDFFDTSTAGGSTITNAGTGTITFNNNSTAETSTIGNAGTLNFNNASKAGSATITNAATGTIAFNDNSTAETSTIGNAGTLNFNNASKAGSATVTNAALATIAFNDNSTAETSTIGNAGTLNFNNASTAGNSGITNNAGGTTQFLDTSTAGNATITNVVNGVTQFFASSKAGSSTINNNGGLTQFNNSSTAENATITTNSGGGVFFVGTSSGGQATFITNTAGVFDMSGLVSGGTTAGSIAGAGRYFLGANALTVGGNNLSTTVSGVISDGGLSGGVGGALIKVGIGTLTLSGLDTFTGGTTVDAGTLVVNGSIAASSLVTVNSGTTLSGTGTVASTTINAGGTLMPGSPGTVGTLSVQGNLVLASAAAYLISINGANASKTSVTGTAAPGGASVHVANGSQVITGQTYRIMTAPGGVSGTFNPAVTFGMFVGTLTYDANDVFLTFKNGALTPVLPPGSPQNVVNVAGAIDSFISTGGTPPLAFQNLFNLTPQQLANALTQLSGEAGTGAQESAFQLMTSFLSLLTGPTGSNGNGPSLPFAPERADRFPADVALAYASMLKAPPMTFVPHWSSWGAAFGGGSTTSGDPTMVGSHDLTAHTGAFAAGIDYHVAADTIVGLSLAGGGTSWGLSAGLGGGHSDAFLAGLYGSKQWGQAYLSGALTYASHWMSTSRSITVAGADTLSASFNARNFGGRLEGGYRVSSWAPFSVIPYAAVQAQSFRAPGYSESGSLGAPDPFALSYASQSATVVRSELGSRFDRSFAQGDGSSVDLLGRVAWAHDWQSNPSLTATFIGLPGATFVVDGATPPANLALLTAGAEWRWRNGWAVLAKFDGEFAQRAQTCTGTARLRYAW